MSDKNIQLADWINKNESSVLQQMLMKSTEPGLISFALGLPAPEFFPAEEFNDLARFILKNKKLSLQYGPPLYSLKSHICRLMAERGVNCREEQIFLTSGAQQGTNLLVNLLLNKGGSVILEEKTYTGFQQVLKPYEPRILIVKNNPADGLDIDAIIDLLEKGERPAFFYTVCDGHNPLASNLSPEKRKLLAEISRKYNLSIIEDDPYGFLHYESENSVPLKAYEPNLVFYAGTFSKTLAPALRTGWLIVPEKLIPHLSNIKEAMDINTSTFNQYLITEFINTGKFTGHLENLRLEYKVRRDAMLSSLETNFSQIARWRSPSHGIFLWLECSPEIDMEKTLDIAIETEKVAFIPGHFFNVDGGRNGVNCARLNFSHSTPIIIEEGISRIARVVKHFIA